ncbi:hypothetical protein HGRIS_008533 [Hohenbuehelia grisea]|uniref:DUF4246 domain-containing protein n=1 Tax=Hohenbuehelia grisea TaxID=104357 RepID=A0ABR3J889_9AGAR
MSQLSAELRSKFAWYKDYTSRTIREQWAADALGRVWKVRIPSGEAEVRLSKKQIEYVLDELTGYDLLRDEESGCYVSCFERIWASDCLLEDALVPRLVTSIASFRSSNRSRPVTSSSDGVSFILDPYLYPLVYHRSLVQHRGDSYSTVPAPSGDALYLTSSSMLPSRVHVSPSSEAIFTSYINNVETASHPEMYASLGSLLSAFIPMFEHTLTDLHRNNPLGQRIPGPCKYAEWDEPDSPEYSDDEAGWVAYERELRAWTLNRPIRLPDVPKNGYIGGLEKRRHQVKLTGRDIYVIVQIEDIRLDPDKPEYAGSSWSVCGMLNERVVACGVYCASMDNVMDPSISFRMAVTSPKGFMAGDTGATLRTWGLQHDDPCRQHLGSAPLRQGGAVCFPNIYQHQYSPFRLTNSERPGHVTMVTFLLVDPELSGIKGSSGRELIPSTASVPPQQREWIARAVDGAIDKRLPVEVVERIMGYVEGLMSRDAASTIRNQMAREREVWSALIEQSYFHVHFDMWIGPGFGW